MKFWSQSGWRSVGMKLFIFLFAAVVVLTGVLGLVSYQVSKGIVREQVSSASAQAVAQAADKLDFLLTEYESSSRQLAVDQVLREDLKSVTTTGISTVQKAKAEERIKRRLDGLTGSDSRLVGVKLVSPTLDSSKSYQSTGGNGVRSDGEVQARIKRIVEAGGKPVWFPTMPKGFFNNTNTPEFAMGRLLRNLQHPEADYILLYQLEETSLGDILSNLKIGKKGEVRLLSAENQVVYAPDAVLLGTESAIQVSPDQVKRKETEFTYQEGQGGAKLAVFQPLRTNAWNLVGYAPESDFLSAADKLLYITLLIILLAMLAAVMLGVALVRMVGRPLNQLCGLMEQAEQGNLLVRTDFRRKDEIGRLGSGFNRMMGQISSLVNRTQETAVGVLSTAEELAGASRSTSHTAEEIAESTREIAAGAGDLAQEADQGLRIIEAMEQQMHQVHQANHAMNNSAGKVIEVSEQGSAYMTDLVEKTGQASLMAERIQEFSSKLNDSTASIRSILQPMVEMTKQTQILSLNASIEASRAGASGKGFMVIAEEIRKLAGQSSESIQDVSAMTDAIQETIEHTVQVLKEVSPLFGEQLQAVQEASSFFQSVRGEMDRFLEQIRQSAASVDALSATQEQLGQMMSGVSAVVQQTSASTEEVASMSAEQFKVSGQLVRLSEQLEELAATLQTTLAAFKEF
ncbi:methyl-accepting chemotaxis protein [Paenibacillus sp. CAA11]|uniref:methyl-accepting chemotaxis protein n=1 Tax=Paenibacillus sp. CAA11 TaxID=1532905 RepID=UPI000D34D76E|nr:methyl-accepting chemotaxis protein [Paenibacillus sp. CAA11]AWB43178.1 methyl-accepting chemotaxis protein [Paenibacillus sp. CAA11]